ncbi:MAG: Na+/H+ antiporter subunit D [Ilumatobacter sp.]|nr:MAG: Na+/H+ antiporter subunit D [Ilumatobacter sp.]
MSQLVPLPIVLPLLGAALSVVFGRWHGFQRLVGVVCLSTSLVISIVLLVAADDTGFVVAQGGGWPAPIGISLVVDRLSAIMLVVSAIMLLAVLVYAIGQGEVERVHAGFHPTYLVLAAGVAASLLTGDLFNLFVSFEMMLAASYVLITMGGRAAQVRSGMTYVVISLVASTFFIIVLALIYSATGTINLADLSERIPELSGEVQLMFAIALLVVFGIKAGLFPLFFWLPDSYPTAPAPVTAIFAGLLTKVGVYAIIRTQTLMFPIDARPATLILVVAALTMTVGVFGAIAQDDVKRILSFHIVSQIGYMIFALGLFTVAGVAAAVFYTFNNIILKTNLLLVAGLVERRGGSSRLSEVGGMVRTAPLLGLLFALPALSLAGLPPFGGFVAKFAVFDAGAWSEQWVLVGVAAFVSLLTMYSMTKIWAGAFWGEREEEPSGRPEPGGRLGGPVLMVGSTAAVVLVGLAVMIWAAPLYAFTERAAVDLLDPSRYVEAVLGERP